MDWGLLMEAAGRMGMSETEFEITTPRYFFHRRTGFESVQREQARNTRIIAFYAIAPHMKKGAIKRPEDLYTLPGDGKRVREYDEDERKRLAKLLEIAKGVDFFKGETMPKIEA